MNDKMNVQSEWKEWIGIGGLTAFVGALTTSQWLPTVQSWYATIDTVVSQVNVLQVGGFLFFIAMIGLYIRQQRHSESTAIEADTTATVTYAEPNFISARIVE